MAHRPHNFRALSKPKKLQKSEQKHYLPYIPLLLLVVGTFLISLIQPIQKNAVLAYATNVSSSGLLQYTNSQRTQNGSGDLQINGALASAAQAKAKDMVARNYWSHTTPDGQQPWIFMDSAGYKYQKAGENLAYGFSNSSETVTGWMNSPTHKANLLDTEFTEVGFGYANSADFNNSGEETIVVAMYGRPQVLAATSQSPSAEPTPAPVKSSTPAQSTPAPSDPVASAPEPAKVAPVTTDNPVVVEPAQVPVSRVQSYTKGQAPWALFVVGLITGVSIVLILLKHAVGLRHLLKNSERFVLHHPLLDTILVSLVLLGSFLSQTTGYIR